MHYGGGGASAVIAVIELAAGVAQLVAAVERQPEPVVVEVVPVPQPEPAPPPPVLRRAPVPTHVFMAPAASPAGAATSSTPGAPAPLDPAAARAALSTRDVASCSRRGVPHGYGHATVVFAPDGSAASVTIDAPAGISPDGVACLGDELGRARMPPFAGGAVSVGTTWFVP